MKKLLQKVVLLLSISLSTFTVYAQQNEAANNTDTEVANEGFWDRAKQSLSKTWHSPDRDLFVPLNTWHNRHTYDRHKIDRYNERPWGLGYAVSRIDDDGDWHSIYAMAFKDSHNKFQPIIGYGYQKYWRPFDGKFALGGGYTLGVTARDDMHWIPIPAPLPIVSINYDRLAIQSTYIPGGHNNGNVLFTWAVWRL